VSSSAVEWRIAVADDTVTAMLEASDRAAETLVVLAHGAGGHMHDRGMRALSELFRARGVDVVRFNFPYSEKKTRRPDPMPVLERCVAAVVSYARTQCASARLFIGGRSMGGRAASRLAAEGFDCDGLLLLAYPLHPAGKPEQLRDAHLSRIRVPALCLNGTRDALCRRDLMDEVVARLGDNFRMHWLEGADHAFHVTKATGRTDADVLREVGDTTEAWIADVFARR
jgi:predicted alpha/beta-hydrolase family hydrolase